MSKVQGGLDMAPRDPHTLDLFEAPQGFYPVRGVDVPRGLSFGGRLKRAISAALKESPLKREEIAAKMAEMMDDAGFSKAALDTLTAESKEDHQISVVRLVSLIRVTGAWSLLDVVAEELGLIVMQGEEARLAERGLIRQQMEELRKREKQLAKGPAVQVRRRL